MRINRYIAMCGICSRRSAENLIKEGKVKINNKVVTNLATEIDEYNDTVVYDGKKIKPETRSIYVLFYKPKGCLCTLSDDRGRKTVMDYLEEFRDYRVFPVGRLDYDTEGLLLITNDGSLSNKLTQPSSEIPKTYIAKIEGTLEQSQLASLRNGVKLDDGYKLKRCKIKVLEVVENTTRLEVTIFEGKNRQIHRMFETMEKQVIFLKRVQIGDLKLGGLSRGSFRYLTDKEVAYLKKF